jgi:hypothetical protein
MADSELNTNNIWKLIAGSSGTLIAIVAALFTVDARYAHAEDVDKDSKTTHKLIVEATQQLRKQSLEDRVFELDLKKAQTKDQKLTPIDVALKERYQRQLDEINSSKKSGK